MEKEKIVTKETVDENSENRNKTRNKTIIACLAGMIVGCALYLGVSYFNNTKNEEIPEPFIRPILVEKNLIEGKEIGIPKADDSQYKEIQSLPIVKDDKVYYAFVPEQKENDVRYEEGVIESYDDDRMTFIHVENEEYETFLTDIFWVMFDDIKKQEKDYAKDLIEIYDSGRIVMDDYAYAVGGVINKDKTVLRLTITVVENHDDFVLVFDYTAFDNNIDNKIEEIKDFAKAYNMDYKYIQKALDAINKFKETEGFIPPNYN